MWINHEDVMGGEKPQSQKAKSCVIPLTGRTQPSRTHRKVVARGRGARKGEMLFRGQRLGCKKEAPATSHGNVSAVNTPEPSV